MGPVPTSNPRRTGADRSGRRSIGTRRRAGVTLLEVILAMGLLVTVSSMTYWFYESSLETRRRGMDVAYKLRLARVISDRIANEIRQASLIATEGRAGIRGTPERIWLSTLRVPRRDLARKRPTREDPPAAEFDLVKLEYKIARHPDILHEDGYELPLGLARVELLRPRADSAQTGEAFNDKRIRVESAPAAKQPDEAALDEEFFGQRAGGELPGEGGAGLPPEIAWEELYAPEFLYLRFCYYDGHTWWDSWELEGDNPLPQLVMITLGFEPHPPFDDEQLPKELEEFCTCMNEDPVDCEPLPADQYSRVVRVPQADPLFRSRIGRETQSLTEKLSGGESTDEERDR